MDMTKYPSEPTRDTGPALACLRAITERSWRVELYRGARYVRVTPLPRAHAAGWVHKESQPIDGYDGPGDWHEVGSGAKLSRQRDGWVCAPVPRSPVAGFTRASRSRLLAKMNQIAAGELTCRPLFVTLTYPRQLLPDWKWAKYQLHHFLVSLFRKFGALPVLWRMEHQDDGAIHYHLMVFQQPYISWWWIAHTWDALIGNQVSPLDSASTQVRRMRSWRQASYYLSKYIAKQTYLGEMDICHGRHWGCRHWSLLPVHRVWLGLTESAGYALRRWLRRLRLARGVRTRDLGARLPFCGPRDAGLTGFVSEADARRMLLLCLGYDPLAPPPPGAPSVPASRSRC